MGKAAGGKVQRSGDLLGGWYCLPRRLLVHQSVPASGSPETMKIKEGPTTTGTGCPRSQVGAILLGPSDIPEASQFGMLSLLSSLKRKGEAQGPG